MALNLPKLKGAALVRRLLPDIEAAVREGATLKQIHSTLKSEHGLTLNFESFRNALYRVRKECQKGKLGTPEERGQEGRLYLGGERKEPPTQEKMPDAPRKKRGIISPKDFRPSEDFEKEIEAIASKKYE